MRLIALLLLSLSFSVYGSQPVKLSKSGICHDEHSPNYERTKHFKAFEDLESCLEVGRMPKGQTYIPPAKTDSAAEYSRAEFGHGWADEDGDCQNTRQELLISMSTNEVKFASDRECRVVLGRWVSLFTGDAIFDASKVDIDHVVPLKWAWDHGADKWSKEKREQFANDPVNLIAVEASLNRQKGAQGPDEWLPPKNQTQYKARFERVLKKYGLTG